MPEPAAPEECRWAALAQVLSFVAPLAAPLAILHRRGRSGFVAAHARQSLATDAACVAVGFAFFVADRQLAGLGGIVAGLLLLLYLALLLGGMLVAAFKIQAAMAAARGEFRSAREFLRTDLFGTDQ